jgi:hypothetical protein
MLYTAFAIKDRAIARRSDFLRPLNPEKSGMYSSTRIISSMLTSCFCLSVSSPVSFSSQGKRLYCILRQYCDRVVPSYIWYGLLVFWGKKAIPSFSLLFKENSAYFLILQVPPILAFSCKAGQAFSRRVNNMAIFFQDITIGNLLIFQ